MNGAAVNVREASKHFPTEAGPVRAVDGISFEVEPGAGLAVTGPSGCGKSTLLSLIGALERPTAGTVEIDGRRVSEMDEGERGLLRRDAIGFVFQSDNLQPFLTAVENVSLQLALSGREGESERASTALSALGLGAALDKYPDQLSGGERQRVAVARALVHSPRLVLADEPTGSLDTDNSLVVVDLLLEARERTGATLIVITHDPAVARRFGHRLALRDGRVAGATAPGREPAAVAAGIGDAGA